MPWIVAVLILALDQLSKHWVVAHVNDGRAHTVIPGLLDWIFVQNTHGAYGLFGDRPWFLIGIAALAFVVLWLHFRDRAQHSQLTAISLGFVLGGAIGNIADRLHYGFVVDFIRVLPLPIFEVFNVADAAISLGIVALVVTSLRNETATP